MPCTLGKPAARAASRTRCRISADFAAVARPDASSAVAVVVASEDATSTAGDLATKHPDESYSEFYARKGEGLTYEEARERTSDAQLAGAIAVSLEAQPETMQSRISALP